MRVEVSDATAFTDVVMRLLSYGVYGGFVRTFDDTPVVKTSIAATRLT